MTDATLQLEVKQLRTASRGVTNELLSEAATILLAASTGEALPADCVRVARALTAAIQARSAPIPGGGGVAGKSGRPGKWYYVENPTRDRFFRRGVPAVADLTGCKAASLAVRLARGAGKCHTSKHHELAWFVREANAAEIAKVEHAAKVAKGGEVFGTEPAS